MEGLGLFPNNIDVSTKVMFANFGDDEATFCLTLLKQLRTVGISSELYPTKAKIKKQMTYANNKGVRYVVLVGEDEIASGILTIKNMESGEQSNWSIADLIKELE
jgi:histidyl-tRNA synthetase